MAETCACGSGSSLEGCCGRFLAGDAQPATAEQLMRSRYTAYALKDSAYLYKTWHVRTQPKSISFDDKDIHWQGLEIVRTEGGNQLDDTGAVEFIARFTVNGKDGALHEVSDFVKENGIWFYLDGKTPQSKTVRTTGKVGRNDPCPCGSGRKYKRCCLAK